MPIQKSLYLEQFEKVLGHTNAEIATLRSSRASAQLLDGVVVEAYGARMNIQEVASVSAPDAQLLVVKPWDKSLLQAIEKAIQNAQLNLNPIVDGEIIRIVVPALTTERRQEMVKLLKVKVEECRVMLRNKRAEIKKDIEAQEGEQGVSEDDIKAEVAELDQVVKDYMAKLDEMAHKKEQDLLSL
jgi:ribosome recycling factor